MYISIVLDCWPRKTLLLLMLLTLTGGQWMLLQSVAWAGMITSRLRTQQVQQAISTTFDGRHKCPLCKAVEQGRKSEKKSEVEVKIPRLEFPPTNRSLVAPDYHDSRSTIFCVDEFAESISCLPPHRPPRLISA